MSGLEVKFSGTTGLLRSVVVGASEVEVGVDFVTYGTRSGKEKSGAYLFLPDGEAKSVLGQSWSNPPVVVTIGPLVRGLKPYSFQFEVSSITLTTRSLDGVAVCVCVIGVE